MGIFYILILLQFGAALTAAKSYIDLMELPDNDEFFWGRRENENLNLGQGLNVSDFAFTQHRAKRQSEEPLLENKDYGACRTSFSGRGGRCRHMIYCRLPQLADNVWQLVSHLCIIEGRSIGICCPEHGDFNSGPQIVSDVKDTDPKDPRIVNRPEQRGCGITTKQFPRITGGRPAEPDEWPWMAAILRTGMPYVWCGATLLTDRHVLTAAHCVHGIKSDQLHIRLGEYNTHEINETRARDFRIANIVTHIDYNPHTYENDIALLRIERPTLFNTYIWTVCLPPLGENWEGRTAVVSGWGTESFAGPHSQVLMEVGVPVWRHEDCDNALVERISTTMLCAGLPEGGQDSCQGDSGGPLMVQLPNRRWVVIGIVSWGVRCGEPNRPGIYTRVDRYLHWIIENSDV